MDKIFSKSPEYAIAPQPQAVLPIAGSDQLFPIHRVFCIGRNYAAHAVEMGHDPDREPPFFFFKTPNTVTSDGIFPYPSETSDVHHEVELVVALGKGGTDLSVEEAQATIWGYGLGLDMTRRDLQSEAKKLGRPWEVGKSFDQSAPCGPLVPAEEIGHPTQGAITLHVNGELRQSGDLNQLLWKVPEMISVLSRYFELQSGDIIMTGTPAGVGAVVRGDVMRAQLDGFAPLEVRVV